MMQYVRKEAFSKEIHIIAGFNRHFFWAFLGSSLHCACAEASAVRLAGSMARSCYGACLVVIHHWLH